MKFTVVTPCWNASGLIADTVSSIASQTVLATGDDTIEYIVIDGGSRDSTVAEVREAWVPSDRASLTVVSEPDQGMYDALVKGLRRATGDVVSYLNAGDYYSRYVMAVVKDCFAEFGVSWLTGMRTLYNKDGAVVSSRVPFRYDRRLIRQGFYGVRGQGRFIQQESTFWSAALMDAVDLASLAQFKLAGDLYLWSEFARRADLDVVAAHLGGFRLHGGHLSDAREDYRAEALRFLSPGNPLGYLRAAAHEGLAYLPVQSRKILPGSGHRLISWDASAETWVQR